MIGFAFSKKNDTVGDFYLGGRKLGPLVTAMSAEASDMSSYLLMGLPGVAYLSGVADVGWTAIGLAVGTYLNWLLVARKLRRYSARTGGLRRSPPGSAAARAHSRRYRLRRSSPRSWPARQARCSPPAKGFQNSSDVSDLSLCLISPLLSGQCHKKRRNRSA